MKAAERKDRDQLILRLWIAGGTYPRIAKTVGLTAARVEQIVKAALAEGASRRALLAEEALAVHQERFERLFNAHWTPALNGDHRSAELCRRMLDQNAKIHGLYADASQALPPPTAPLNGDGDGAGQDSEESPTDELAQLRAARAGA